MNRKRIFQSILLLLLASTGLQAQEKNTKVVFVIVDGISADQLDSQNTPHLNAIAKVGGYTHAYVGGKKDGYSQTPTISAVGYNSLLTGTWANKHNVWGNSIKDPNYKYWTVFRYAKEYKPQLKTAVFSSWLDNRTKLVGDGLPQTDGLKVTYHADGYEHDSINFPHGDDRWFMHLIDEKVTDEASSHIRNQSPDLSWVYLEYTDDMGHRHGDSDEFHQAIQYMDQQIGRLYEAITCRQNTFGEHWEIYITTDHGRREPDGKHHGGQSDRERSTWIVTNAQDLNSYFEEETPAIVDILPAMLRSLDIQADKKRIWELDGTSITGPISLSNLDASLDENILSLSWKHYGKSEKLKVWISTTNNFAEGGTDDYSLLGKVKSSKETAQFELGKYKGKQYKIVVEGKHNSNTVWAVPE